MKTLSDLLVSIIITSYNQEATFCQTIESILAQEVESNIEILIADDFSYDKTRSLAKEYQEKYPKLVRLVFQPENIGVGSNWALAVQQAKGKYIFTCAADDFWHNRDKLQIQIQYMENCPQCGLLYTDYDVLDITTNKTTKSYLSTYNKICPQGGNLIKQIFTGTVPILTVTTCFRKYIFDTYVPVDDYVKYKFTLEDWPTWLILSKYCEVHYLPFSTSTYRIGYDSVSNPMTYEKIEKRFFYEHIMYKYLCNKFPDDLHYNENDYLNYKDVILLNLSYKKGDYNRAKKYAQIVHQRKYKTIKSIMALNPITFFFFSILRDCLKKLKS